MTNATILLVEDNPDDEALTLRAFKKAQIENPIVVARDGQEAIDLLHGPDRVHPAMVLLDLKLPKIDGLDVLARLRQDPRTRTLPVVVLTSSREEEDLVRSYQLGANSYVRKPVGLTEFIDAARQLGLYWLVLNERPAGLDA
jgi:CheY-like chemotaxis protein